MPGRWPSWEKVCAAKFDDECHLQDPHRGKERACLYKLPSQPHTERQRDEHQGQMNKYILKKKADVSRLKFGDLKHCLDVDFLDI